MMRSTAGMGFVGVCVVLLLAVCLSGSCQPGGQAPASQAEVVVDQLNTDVQLIQALNRLDLKAEQVTALLAIVEKMQADATALTAEREAVLTQMVPLLREKRAALIADKTPSDELEDQIFDLSQRLEQINDGAVDALRAHSPEIRQILTEAQLQILTGADEAAAQAAELLEWIRGLSAAQFAEEGQPTAEELADPEVELTADAITKIFNEARAMTAADFATRRLELASRLAPLYMPLPEAAEDSLAQFFGSARMATILRERAGRGAQ